MYMVKGEGVDLESDRFLSIGLASAAAILVVIFGLLSSPVMSYVRASLSP